MPEIVPCPTCGAPCTVHSSGDPKAQTNSYEPVGFKSCETCRFLGEPAIAARGDVRCSKLHLYLSVGYLRGCGWHEPREEATECPTK